MILLWITLGVLGYTYAGYPFLLWLSGRRVGPAPGIGSTPGCPPITICLPVHNGATHLARALDALLVARYPGPRQIVVTSDGSTDETEAIVARYRARGVELLTLPVRVGKSEAENRTLDAIRGEIVINTDASVWIHPEALTALVQAFDDPVVGVASSVDVSVDTTTGRAVGEGTYVGYEMWLRGLETRAGGIVGASGSLYAIRASLHRRVVPPHLSRDFSSALHARAAGYRSVSVPTAICFVPKGRPRADEYRRKVRTMARGLATLAADRRLLDPRRYGGFAWRLFSHKLLRWLTPVLIAATALALLLPGSAPRGVRLLVAAGSALATLGWWWPGAHLPRLLALPGYAAAAVVAGVHAWWVALAGGAAAVWEPTRRDLTTPGGGRA